jgi:putative glycosyltransferase (TIGR04372 family)
MTLLAYLCAWIGRLTGTIVIVPFPIAVGNCAEEIMHGLLKAQREGKKLVLLHQFNLPWPLHYRMTNGDLIDVDSDYRVFSRHSLRHVIGSTLITLYAAIFRIARPFAQRLGYTISDRNLYPFTGFETLWQPKPVMPEFSWDVVAQYNWPTELHKKVPVHLSRQKRAAGQRECERLGLPGDAWYICLHVRESGFHKDTMTERNADILNYLEAIREITDRGGWVVRMGDDTMTRLPTMERVIDHPFTPSKSYAMDIYLMSECRFYIGMQSGIYDLAMLFQRPMILTNMASWLYPFPFKEEDLGLPKHVYSRSRQRFLSVQEWMLEPFNATSFRELGEDYVLYENDPAELRMAVREFLDRGVGIPPTDLQREFNELRRARGREILSQPIYTDNSFLDHHQRYRLASRLDSALGNICAGYLRKNWHCDSMRPAEVDLDSRELR